jgi:hypothetical protein
MIALNSEVRVPPASQARQAAKHQYPINAYITALYITTSLNPKSEDLTSTLSSSSDANPKSEYRQPRSARQAA